MNDLRKMLNGASTSIYITDVDTYEILFMNQTMKDTYHLKNPEGKRCWELLQKGQDGPCPFCPVKKLKEAGELYRFVTWREHSDLVNSVFENHDGLIQWIDGRTVHIQQSLDITDNERLNEDARKDDLCAILNRRAGKQDFFELMQKKREEGEPFVLALIDVNRLKKTNDSFGHAEGDFLLRKIALGIKDKLGGDDIFFRLSGDEFVIVFAHREEADADHFLRENQKHLRSLQKKYDKPYGFSYSYGLCTIPAEEKLTVDDAIAKADVQMYHNKNESFYGLSEEQKISRVKEFTYNSAHLYEALLESTDDYIYICDMKTGVFRYSPAQVKDFALPGEIIENPLVIWRERVHPDDWPAFYESSRQIAEGENDFQSIEFRAKKRSGEYVWLKCRGQVVRDGQGQPDLLAGVIVRLGHKQKIDALTNLYVREELKKAFTLKIKDRAIENLAVMTIDIDNLKLINEMYGRTAGDYLIKKVAELIQESLYFGMGLYKLDGNQFGVLIGNSSEEEIEEMYRKIQQKIQQEETFKLYEFPIQVSAGCAIYARGELEYDEIVQHVDYALQYAKENGRNRLEFFSRSIFESKIRTLEILKYLQRSVQNDFQGFELYYQPQIYADSKQIKGVEALLRWQCPELGAVSPAETIPVLEESRLIIQVGLWVMREAMRAAENWRRQEPNFSVSINVSARQILESDFVEDVKAMLAKEHLTPENIVLELTESCMIKNKDSLRNIFARLRKLGFKIAMDDFGTGYASLGILKSAPSDIVKIDRMFVSGIKDSSFDKTFIRFITEICHNINVEVVLEGVETEDEARIVEPMNLDYIQGFLYGRPQSESSITEKISGRQ